MKLAKRAFESYSQFIQSDFFVKLAGVNAVVGANVTILQTSEWLHPLHAGVLGAFTGVSIAFASPFILPLGVASLPAVCYNAYKSRQ